VVHGQLPFCNVAQSKTSMLECIIRRGAKKMIGKSQEGQDTSHAHSDAEDRGAGDTSIVTVIVVVVVHGSSGTGVRES
jgi:hypothetical protein